MKANGTPGIGVDAHGGGVIDPTSNVLALVEAAVTRQDDLREAGAARLNQITELRAEHNAELIRLRSEYDDKLRAAEALRINAIRAVDVDAVQRAAEVVATQQLALQAQVTASAETVRAAAAAAAVAVSDTLTRITEPIIKDIADLRRSQYEGVGQKTQIVETQAIGASTGMVVGLVVSGVFSLLFLTVAIVSTGLSVYFGTR